MIEEITFADWLTLREPADAAARRTELVDRVRERVTGTGPLVIHDLGAGTGSMGRWLAPRLPGPQHWVVHDREEELLTRAAAGLAGVTAADGTPVTVATRAGDITRLTPADLAGAALVTASALLDMLTLAEVDRIVTACAGAGCPTLFMLSVVGEVTLTPADPLDAELAAAFNDHQRRTHRTGPLLGPEAARACEVAFARQGVPVTVAASPWLLGPEQAALTGQWLAGWVAAACGQRPELAGPAAGYLRRRTAEAAAGGLHVSVGHLDLLAGCG
jgi:hypothetical protein